MTLPLKVLNRLRLGRDVAAKISPTLSGCLAWVYVLPLLNPIAGEVIVDSEIRFVSINSDNPVRGFYVRYVEIDEKIVEEFYEERRQSIGTPPIDLRVEVASEEELEQTLKQWMTNFEDFHIPCDTGYWFEQSAELLPDDVTFQPNPLIREYEIRFGSAYKTLLNDPVN